MKSMTLRNWATLAASVFIGGASGWASQHITSIPADAADWRAAAAGCVFAGLAAVFHLFEPKPAPSAPPPASPPAG